MADTSVMSRTPSPRVSPAPSRRLSPVRRVISGSLWFIGTFLVALAALSFQSLCLAEHVEGHEADPQSVDRFAPGAKGDLEGLALEAIIERARRLGAEMKTDNLAAPDLSWDAHSDAQANVDRNPEARAAIEQLLGLEPGSAGLPASARKTGSNVIVFVSFAMPDAALRQLARDATKAGATLVTQGFVNNSATDTAVAINRVFGSETEVGFAVDPTAFHRFAVTAVPTVISLEKPLTACKTRHCADDPTPSHDRIAGNATLAYMLEALKERGEIATAAADEALFKLRLEP